jgi:hypothetical protein
MRNNKRRIIMSILTLVVSILFSFDYSFMMEQRGYFPSDSGNYWSLVRNKYGDENVFYISECFQYGDTLNCMEYWIDCGQGWISRQWDDNEAYVDGIPKDYWDIHKTEFFENLKEEHSNERRGEKQSIFYSYPGGEMKCSFINGEPILGFRRGCSYTGIVIESGSYESKLCKEGVE